MLVMKFTNMSEEKIDEFLHFVKRDIINNITYTTECLYEAIIITDKNIGEFVSFVITDAYYIVDTDSWGFLINHTGESVMSEEFKEEILTYIMMYSKFN